MTPQRPAGAGTPLTPDQAPPNAVVRTSAKGPAPPPGQRSYTRRWIWARIAVACLLRAPRAGNLKSWTAFPRP